MDYPECFAVSNGLEGPVGQAGAKKVYSWEGPENVATPRQDHTCGAQNVLYATGQQAFHFGF